MTARMTVGDRYTRVAIWFHWAIAAFILLNLAVGYFMEGLPAPYRSIVVALHISSGISVLVLSVVRIVWRLTHRPPPFAAGTSRAETLAARLVHLTLYVAMIAMPLTGWAIISAHPPKGSLGAAAEQVVATKKGAPRRGRDAHYIWGVVRLPMLGPVEAIGVTPGGLPAQHQLHDDAASWHANGGFILIGLLLLHVIGALKHELIDGQQELARMGLRRTKRGNTDVR